MISAIGLLLSCCVTPAAAWNALGHRVVAEIAWRQITPEQRQMFVDTLRRHPQFDVDFASPMPDDVLQADTATQDHWVFQAAAYWPDVARGGPFDRPTWHYINLPLFMDSADDQALRDRLAFNQSIRYPPAGDLETMNVLQAIQYAQATIANASASPSDRALAYCWLFHLVGDIHQPLHAVSLVSFNQFPQGDRGGNSIPLRRGRNLHALWDGLLGTGDRMRDIDREVAELSDRSQYGDFWNVASRETEPQKWAEESRTLCESAVYSKTILDAVRNTPAGARLEPVDLPDDYMRAAGRVARQRMVAAGVRLGVLLKEQR